MNDFEDTTDTTTEISTCSLHEGFSPGPTREHCQSHLCAVAVCSLTSAAVDISIIAQVPGTVVVVQHADQRYVEMSNRPYENISYFNFAPIHIGGTDQSLAV